MTQEHARGSASTREAQAGDSARPANTQGKGDAWRSENHSSSSGGVWGRAAFNEEAQRSDSSPSTQAVEESAETMRSGPVTMPHSISYRLGQPALAVRPGWALCPLLFQAMNALRL